MVAVGRLGGSFIIGDQPRLKKRCRLFGPLATLSLECGFSEREGKKFIEVKERKKVIHDGMTYPNQDSV